MSNLLSIGIACINLQGMEKSLAALLKTRIEERHGGNQAEFARAHGFKPVTLNRWVTGKVTFPQIEARRQIAHALGISHIDLLVAIGELDREESGQPIAPAEDPNLSALLSRIRGMSPAQVKAMLALSSAVLSPLFPEMPE